MHEPVGVRKYREESRGRRSSHSDFGDFVGWGREGAVVMSSSRAVDFVPSEIGGCPHCNSRLQDARAELAAYMMAVEQRFGRQAAELAGAQWIDLFEQRADSNREARSEFRKISILAASRL